IAGMTPCVIRELRGIPQFEVRRIDGRRVVSTVPPQNTVAADSELHIPAPPVSSRLSAFAEDPEHSSSSSIQPTEELEQLTMRARSSFASLNSLDGYLGAALVDAERGEILAHDGGARLDLATAGAGHAEVLRAKRAMMERLGLQDRIEDLLITLGRQYHMLR